jgi:hypothetical protein
MTSGFDGTSKQFSHKYFGRDCIAKAADYDIGRLGQKVR